MFISFDGLDGTGKSTQSRLLAEWFRARGREVVGCRDPGSTSLGENLRRLLLDPQGHQIGRQTETLMYMAARAQLVEEIIRPALEAGKVVISDRFLLANVVYQGHAGGLDVAELWRLGAFATAGVMPRIVFVLELSEESALGRLNRPLDRIELRGNEYRARVRAGFLAEAAKSSSIKVLNADRAIEVIHQEVCQEVERL